MWILKLVIIVIVVEKGVLISPKKAKNDSLELLWNLTNLAVQQSNLQERQRENTDYPQTSQRYTGQEGYFGAYPQSTQRDYPFLQRPLHGYPDPVRRPEHHPDNQFQSYPSPSKFSGGYLPQYPHYQKHPYALELPYPFQKLPAFPLLQGGPSSIMDVLHSVAQNDELHCVPKLLCELTSRARSDNRQSSLLPFNINMNSFFGLLSQLGPNSNPLFLFGRAALLGYTSQGSESSCYSAFSKCPNDPDQLVNYLNNYNGGFFRYFNRYQTPQNYGFPSNGNQLYYEPQKRILSPGNNLITNKYFRRFLNDDSIRLSKRIKLPDSNFWHNSIVDNQVYTKYKSGKTLTFPDDTSGHKAVRSGKTLSFPDAHYHSGLDFQMVHPSHMASPYIFPTRTGTGKLLLDTEELN